MTEVHIPPPSTRGRQGTSPSPPQDTLPMEASHLLPYGIPQKSGLMRFFVKNIALLALLSVALLALACFLDLEALLKGKETCKMHHDEFLGKLWLECPEAIRRAFGPRR